MAAGSRVRSSIGPGGNGRGRSSSILLVIIIIVVFLIIIAGNLVATSGSIISGGASFARIAFFLVVRAGGLVFGLLLALALRLSGFFIH